MARKHPTTLSRAAFGKSDNKQKVYTKIKTLVIMRKNVLVSILAMTSATPLTALANANLDNINTEDITAWGDESTGIKFEGSTIVSPNGVTVSQKIGKLLQGTYKLEAELTNAKILVNGTALNANSQFELKSETDVTITIEAVKEGEELRAGGFKLELVFDFDAAREQLVRALSVEMNKINSSLHNHEALTKEATDLMSTIQALGNDTDGEFNAYEDYKNYQLWNGWEGSSLNAEIKTLAGKITGSADSKTAYDAADAVIKAQESALATANEKLEALTGDKKTYVEKTVKALKETAGKIVTDYRTAADEANADGTAATVCTEEKNKTFTTEASAAIKAYSDAIDAAGLDHDAYTEIKPLTDDVKTAYDNAQAAITANVRESETEVGVFENMLNEAQKALNDINVTIQEVENTNGTDEPNSQAAENLAANREKLTACAAQINEVSGKYTTWVSEVKNAYKTATEKLKGYNDTYTNYSENPAVNAEYSEALNEIKTLIGELTSKIDADYKAYTINDADYTAEYAAIETALNNLKEDAQADIDNYNAMKELVDFADDVNEDLAAAIEEVSQKKSENDKYAPADKLKGTADGISQSITAFKAEVETEYDAKTCDDNKVTLEGKLGNISRDIQKYIDVATEAVASYNAVVADSAAFNKAIETLTGSVKNPSVTCSTQGGKTYGALINEYKQERENIAEALKEALAKTDEEHITLLTAAVEKVNNATPTDNIAALAKLYTDDEKNYNEDVADKAYELMLTTVKGKHQTGQDKLAGIELTQESVGSELDALNEEKNALQGRLDAENSKIGEAEGNSDKSAALAVLSEVNTALTEINDSIGKFEEKVGGIKEFITDINDKSKEAEDAIKGINETLDKVATAYKDPAKNEYYNGEITKQTTTVNKLTQEIDAAKADESLLEKWEDTTGEGGTAVKGFGTRLAEAETAATSLLAEAEDWAKNYLWKEGIVTYYGEKDFSKLASDANTAIAEVAGDGALKFYNGSVNKVMADVENFMTKVNEAYEKGDCDGLYKNYKADLDGFAGKIEDIPGLAKTNKTFYDDQTVDYDSKNTAWSEVYYQISTTDESSKKEEYLNSLTEQKTALNNVKAVIEDSYVNGLSKEKDGDIDKALTDISVIVESIRKKQMADYDEIIGKDNKYYLEQLKFAVDCAKSEFSAALDILGMYNKIENEELAAKVSEEVITANNTISGILADLRKLYADAEKEMNNLDGGVLFDPDKKYLAEAQAKRETIKKALETLDANVRPEVDALFNSTYNNAKEALDTAVAELEEAGYGEEVIKEAFTETNAIIDAAGKAEAGSHFALTVDDHLNALQGVSGLIEEEKDAAAVAEWDVIYNDAVSQSKEELEQLNKFVYVNDEDETTKNGFIKRYNDAIELNLTPANEAFVNTPETQKYETFTYCRDMLNAFKAEAGIIFTEAKNAQGTQVENQAAYDAITARIDYAQELLDKAAAYVDAYAMTEDVFTEAYQSKLDDLRSSLIDWYKEGTCLNNKPDAEDKITDVITQLSTETPGNVYATANEREVEAIEAGIKALRESQNLAAEAVEGDEEKMEAVDNLLTEINNLQPALDAYLNSDEYTSLADSLRQPGLLEKEAEVAVIRTELTKFYDTEIGGTTYANLLAAATEAREDYDEVNNMFVECHESVQARYAIRMARAGERVNVVVDKVMAYKDNNDSILYYTDKLEYDIESIKADIEELNEEITASQKPFKDNEEAKTRLMAEWTELNNEYASVLEKLNGYTYAEAILPGYEQDMETIVTYLNLSKENIESRYESVSLDENSTLSHKSYLERRISELEDNATYYDRDYQIKSHPTESLNALRIAAWNATIGKNYLEATLNDLKTVNTELSTAILNLGNYNSDARDGVIYYDIDGNAIYNEETGGITKDIDYVKEAVPEIDAKIAEIKAKIADMSATIANEAYIIGDVTNDGEVLVDDYTTLINIALGIDVPEAGTIEFEAADVNGDNNLNVGDVTGLVKILLGDYTYTSGRVAVGYAAGSADTATDKLRLSAEAEGDITHVTVRLDASKAYVGFQMDLKLPAGVTLLNESLGGCATDHNLYSNTLADGTHRIIISSLQNSEFNAGGDALVHLEVSGRNANRITAASVMATDASGMLYSIIGDGADGTTGIDGVNAEKSLKEKIYSVGGQVMDTLKKGINIIRNADGSTKKVIKK